MIHRPAGMGQFQFATLANLRAAQLLRGCRPKVEVDGSHKATVIAQMEVAQGMITQSTLPAVAVHAALAVTDTDAPFIVVG
ncbi:MAG: DNA-directed RNA polymerase subunit omega [Acidobacteriota bacterium]|nr:DNA-directed RNA polymerase subunit omega [Acidobacteriota bacterium]